MPAKKCGKPANKTNARKREQAGRIEQLIYDWVYDSFGESEALNPSWYIPELARYIADNQHNENYVPKHKPEYEEE